MITYVWWIFTNIVGPGGPETIRISNIPCTPSSGPHDKQSFISSLTKRSFAEFYIDDDGVNIGSDGLVTVKGFYSKSIGDVTIANSRRFFGDTVRDFDYLFTEDYDLSDVDVEVSIGTSSLGVAPSSMTRLFTGKLKRISKTDDTVSFHIVPVSDRANVPLLKHRFNGMGSAAYHLTLPFESLDPVPIIGSDWTVMVYALTIPGPSPGKNSYFSVVDGLDNPIIDIYLPGGSGEIKLDIKHGGGTDTYSLYVTPFDFSDLYHWISVSWDQSMGVFNVWIDSDLVVEDEPILNNPAGIAAKTLLSKIVDATFFLSSVRVFDEAKSSTELETLRAPIAYGTIESLARWEFDRGLGEIITDHSGNARHISRPGLVWIANPSHGEPSLKDVIMPTAFGTCFGVPIIESTPRMEQFFAVATGWNISRLYSKGVELAKKLLPQTRNYIFNHLTSTISVGPISVWGNEYVRGQEIEITSNATFGGVYVIADIVPSPQGKEQTGNDFRFDIVVESQSWPYSATESATVQIISGQEDWEMLASSSLYDPSVPSLYVRFNGSLYPQPIAADVTGDPRQLVTSPPPGYFPSGDFSNVILQLLREYGPEFDGLTVPSVPFGYIPYFVGYYAQNELASDVVNDISSGCSVWVSEQPDGTFSIAELKFPEEVVGSSYVSADSVVFESITNRRRYNERSSRPRQLVVNYGKFWNPVSANDIPEVVDPAVRNYVSKEWRSERVGSGEVIKDAPEIFTYVNDRDAAIRIGERVLRLSQGEIFEFAIRVLPNEQPTLYNKGSKIVGDLSSIGLSSSDKIVLSKRMSPGTGTITIMVWFEP